MTFCVNQPGADCAAGAEDGFPSSLFKRDSKEMTNFCMPSTNPRNWLLSFSNTAILSNSSEPGILKFDTPSTLSSDDLMCWRAFAISEASADEAQPTPF